MSQMVHTGTIVAVGEHSVTVRLNVDKASCGGCALASACKKPQTQTLPWAHPSADLIGKEVKITISERSRRKAETIFLVAPVAVLLSVALACSIAGLSETIMAIASIGAVAIYYLILYIIKPKSTDIVICGDDTLNK